MKPFGARRAPRHTIRGPDPARLVEVPAALARAIAALSLALWTGAGPAVAQVDALTPRAREAVSRFAEQLAVDVEVDGIGGITAGVGFGAQIVWAQGFGWADRDRAIPASPETIYRTGSISKSFTAVLLALLADRGAIGLDEPVEQRFPEIRGLRAPPAGAASITYRRLASHTAGLVREPALEGAAAGPIERWEDQVVASIPTTGFRAPPGDRYAYSNIGFGILGLAVSRAVGIGFIDLVRDEIFIPLGMTSSTFVITDELQARLATGYRNRRDGSVDADLPAREHAGRGYKVPNGGVYSTVADLARFASAVSGGDGALLSEEMQREVLSIQTPESDTTGYGLGFSVRIVGGWQRIAGHGGSVAGYTAYLVFAPDEKISVMVLRNYNVGRTNLGRSATGLLSELVEAQRAP